MPADNIGAPVELALDSDRLVGDGLDFCHVSRSEESQHGVIAAGSNRQSWSSWSVFPIPDEDRSFNIAITHKVGSGFQVDIRGVAAGSGRRVSVT